MGQGGRAALLVSLSVNEMAFEREVVVKRGVDRGKLLQVLQLPEPQHRPFASSERQVAVLGAVVGPAADLLLRGIAELVHRRPVGAQPVSSDAFGRAVTLQRLLHEGQGGRLFAGLGDVAFENLAF